jgi:hypothetical protein
MHAVERSRAAVVENALGNLQVVTTSKTVAVFKWYLNMHAVHWWRTAAVETFLAIFWVVALSKAVAVLFTAAVNRACECMQYGAADERTFKTFWQKIYFHNIM